MGNITPKEAIEILKEVANHYCDDVDACEWCDKTICSVKVDEAIKALERPQGEWIQTEVIDDDSEYGVNGDASECSNCKHIENSHYWTTTYYNFCPNCGADMRKGGAK